jgi:hypothetical protein
MQEERHIMEEIRQLREEAVRFHSRDSKPERQRWVVREFLSTLGIDAGDEEMISPPEADPLDVKFGSARFQLKEIYDPTERRQAEVKEELQRAKTAMHLGDLFGELPVRDMRHVDVCPLMTDVEADPRYITTRAGIDLLFYVTRVDATANLPTEVPAVFQSWRSVSCLFGSKPIIIAVQQDAPSFLRFARGGA